MKKAKPRGNPAKLQPCRDTETAKRRGSMGGKKKGENAKKKRTYKDIFDSLLSKKISVEHLDTEAQKLAEEKNIPADEALCLAAIAKGLKGDMSAQTYIRDTKGEKPSDKLEVETEMTVIFEIPRPKGKKNGSKD